MTQTALQKVPVSALASQEEWWTRESTAKYLGISERKVRMLAQGGRLRRQHVPPGPGRPYQTMLYLAGDAIAYRAARAAGDGGTHVPSIRQADAPAGSMPAAIALLAEKLRPAPRVRPWLTLDEAADYSGLPKSYLLGLAKSGYELAVNVGKPARPRWRFNRDKL